MNKKTKSGKYNFIKIFIIINNIIIFLNAVTGFIENISEFMK